MRTATANLARATFPLAALAALIGLAAPPAHAQPGTFIVSGDIQLAKATNAAGMAGSGSLVNPGNQQFFQNVLGAGTKVIVETSSAGGNADDADPALVDFYQGLSGVTVTEVTAGQLTASDLTGAGLFLDAVPDAAFGTGELSALQGFSQGGGTIFLLGDNVHPLTPNQPTDFHVQDAAVNADLTALGSSLQIVPGNLDDGYQTGTGSQIVADPLTTGVTSFTYGGVSSVSGGRPLFLTSPSSGGQPFVEAESPVVAPSPSPEPSQVSVFALGGLALCGLALRARRKG